MKSTSHICRRIDLRRLLPVVTVLLAVACTDPVGPRRPDEAELSFEYAGIDAPASDPRQITWEVNGRELTVRGPITAPSPCHVLRHTEADRAFMIILTIEAVSTGGCLAITGEFTYRLQTTLNAGEYLVVIKHRYPETGWTEVIAGDTVLHVK